MWTVLVVVVLILVLLALYRRHQQPISVEQSASVTGVHDTVVVHPVADTNGNLTRRHKNEHHNGVHTETIDVKINGCTDKLPTSDIKDVTEKLEISLTSLTKLNNSIITNGPVESETVITYTEPQTSTPIDVNSDEHSQLSDNDNISSKLDVEITRLNLNEEQNSNESSDEDSLSKNFEDVLENLTENTYFPQSEENSMNILEQTELFSNDTEDTLSRSGSQSSSLTDHEVLLLSTVNDQIQVHTDNTDLLDSYILPSTENNIVSQSVKDCYQIQERAVVVEEPCVSEKYYTVGKNESERVIEGDETSDIIERELRASLDVNNEELSTQNVLFQTQSEPNIDNAIPCDITHQMLNNEQCQVHDDVISMGGVANSITDTELLLGFDYTEASVQDALNLENNSDGNTAFLRAARAGNLDKVLEYLKSNIDINTSNANGLNALHLASKDGHVHVVTELLRRGATVDAATKKGNTALHIASLEDVVKILVQHEASVNVQSQNGFTPLYMAAQENHDNVDGFTPLAVAMQQGHDKVVAVLLENDTRGKHNITPLHVAAKWGKTNMVSLLIEKGANIEAKTRDGLTPLHCAARSGHEQVVDMLLERGAPISSKTKNGLAPLHMASQGDHVDAARILLYHKAPVDEVTVDYLTALHVAAHCGHVRVAKLLLDRKADPNARALNGFTPLHIACKKNRIKVANPDVPTVRGETPLHLAARANQTDIIRILLRNGAQVDARARQTPLHIASRLGNVDIVMLLLQHGAAVDATTKDMYTALHIAAKEGQEEVASVLLENGASLTATTKKGFTPLHLAAKYGNMKNGVTPLHVASHYDHQNVALLLLDKGASPHATAKNGHTPLHIAARKNQMDIATTLLEYGAKANAESKAGFTPLHLSAQEGHTDMSTLLIEHQADPNHKSKNGLSPLHLCAQEDRVNVASILVKNGAEVDAKTKLNMVRFLLQHGVDVNSSTSAGYTPLHQAAQQGHTLIINLLLENKAAPNAVTNQGQTALSIAQKLGYISVVETLKVVTETVITTTTTTIVEEKYRVMAPETMQETFMSDSEDEGGDDLLDSAVYGKPTHAQHIYLPYYEGQMLLTREDTMLSDQPYRYLTVDEMKSLGDDSLPIDVTRDERGDSNRDSMAPPTAIDDSVSPVHVKDHYVAQHTANYAPDNVDIARHPVHVGKLQWKTFLVSFMVDARGGAMRGCRHSGVRVIVPPRKAAMPMRITCRYLKKDKLTHPPPLMEGEALASRILELGPVGAKFLGPVIIEVPHFGSLRGKEREIVILRSDNGETWREHTLEASEEAIQDYFAIVSRVRQEVHAIGPEGGMVSSSVVPQVQAVFPQGALTKKIKVGLQ
ncbi:hypothetical protein B566_EDAN007890, partial [Ephemera danica]